MRGPRHLQEAERLVGQLELSLLELEMLLQSGRLSKRTSEFEAFVQREITAQSYLAQKLRELVKKVKKEHVPLIDLAINRAHARSRQLMMDSLERTQTVPGLRH